MHRVTISIDDDLMADLDHYLIAGGHKNRSEAVRDMVRASLARQVLQSDGSDQCVAALVYVYEPETRQMAARLMADHYQCADISVARTHVGIDEGSCLEVSMLRGRRSEVEKFARRIIGERGVRHGQLVAVPCKSDQ